MKNVANTKRANYIIKMKRGGAISLMTMFSIAGGVAAFIFGGINYVNVAIAPVMAQTSKNTADISAIHEDIIWIKESLQAKGFHPATSTP